jgi:hypothetical protein
MGGLALLGKYGDPRCVGFYGGDCLSLGSQVPGGIQQEGFRFMFGLLAYVF